MEERKKLVVEAILAFARELVPKAPHARAEYGPEIIHVFSGRHPVLIFKISFN
jgi:hypothetical protein